MRAVVQRVTRARVLVDDQVVGSIGHGLVVLLGVGQGDTDADVEYLANKITGLRVFSDDQGQMNLGVRDVDGALLVVSQFTLYGDCRKGKRPSFVRAMKPEQAEILCAAFVNRCQQIGVGVQSGQFRAMMHVELCNNGPVTLLVDSRKEF